MAVASNVLPLTLVKSRTDRRRSAIDRFFRALCGVAAVVAIVPLFAGVAFVVVNGISAPSIDLLTKAPKAAGGGGGAPASLPRPPPPVGPAPTLPPPFGGVSPAFPIQR